MKNNFTFRQTILTRCVLAACGASAAVLAVQPAFAQTAAPTLQRVEVTGSNIKRTDAETASPVQVVTREDIERSGKASVAELLQSLAVDNQGSVPMTFGNGFAKGASGISLRGLGVASTLVLINGRRIAPYGNADDGQKVFADLNVIPTEGVERIEILKDGASAIYGSDAVAGVVNIILRKDFKGTVAKANIGQSRYGDGRETRASITHGFGNIDEDKYNVLLNFELGKTNEVWNRERAGRGQIGKSDGRAIGFDASGTIGGGGAGGTGAIVTNNAAGSSLNGNVRNPVTNDYYSRGNPAGVGFTRQFPGANCANFSSIPQGGDKGGCLFDGPQQFGQIQPSQETINFFGRGATQINADMQAYAELNIYSSKSNSSSTPSPISGSVGYPGGPVSNAGVSLGAAHPDNPYFGTAARFRYAAGDVGPRVSKTESDFNRVVLGLKGTVADWDYDTAFLYSSSKGSTVRTGQLQRDVTFALLNPTAANVAAARAGSAAYAALPAGTYWRIGENGGLNSAALYAALSPAISDSSETTTTQLDFKATREFGQLAGGKIGVAVGAEVRKEEVQLKPTTGTDRGNIIGLGYSAYKGNRNVVGVYGEALFPITKTVELSAALRGDRYSDYGNSVTPKLGAKWTPAKELVLRGTYSEGFRAPSAAENGVGGLAAFSSAVDPVRCALGIQPACAAGTVALITTGNPNLQPEKSKNLTLGVVWEPSNKSSVSFDLWQIIRKNEINQGLTSAAIAAGSVSRDPSTATAIARDPGAITAVLVGYINSAQTTVRGFDVDGRHRIDLPGGNGKVTFDAKWTYLATWLRTEKNGDSYDYAGTHGNCDTSNCMGTPKNRVNLATTWEQGDWRVSGILSHRGKLSNTLFKADPDGCASHLANGNEAPKGCKVGSFTSVDLTVRYKATPRTEVFGTIRNLFDATAPFDPLTYGATGYNPADYTGAVGRYFSVGVRHQF
jgi:iron complex outermembrane recepter protein